MGAIALFKRNENLFLFVLMELGEDENCLMTGLIPDFIGFDTLASQRTCLIWCDTSHLTSIHQTALEKLIKIDGPDSDLDQNNSQQSW